MSKKSKTSEINDIIDSSYAEPDYSYANDHHESVDSRQYRNTTTNTNTNINTQRSSYDNGNGNGSNTGINPFLKPSNTYPSAPVSAPANASHANTNTSNIFMKYTGGSKTNTNTNTNTENVDKSVATPRQTEIKNTEDEFPSLGGSKRFVASVPTLTPAPAAMNFKKIVETKKPVEIVVQPQLAQAKTNSRSNASQYKSYEELKYYSEKSAKSRIYGGGYSDDDMDDEMEDEMDNNNYYNDDQ